MKAYLRVDQTFNGKKIYLTAFFDNALGRRLAHEFVTRYEGNAVITKVEVRS